MKFGVIRVVYPGTLGTHRWILESAVWIPGTRSMYSSIFESRAGKIKLVS